MRLDPSSRTTVLVHYYRAMVNRADVWRMRMDASTNWAIGATAAIVSFTLSDASVPHYVVSIAPLMTLCFLVLEARRLTFYNLFQGRALLLERGLVRAALQPVESDVGGVEPPDDVDLAAALGSQLGRTVPTMPLRKAAARRLRRVYLYLFGVQTLAWCLKLANHPNPVASFDGLVERAAIGAVPGVVTIALGLGLVLAGIGTAALWGGVERERS